LSNIDTNKALSRWYPLIDHPTQLALINDNVRFKVVAAGRRSGKTERAKRFVVKQAFSVPHHYFIAAPTRDQVERIYWQDLKALCLCDIFPKNTVKISEKHLTLFLPNGAEITLIGLDRPQRMEGILWGGGVIDEIADVKAEAWDANIKPALDTFNPLYPQHRAWCWLIGVPDGLNHYYDKAQHAQHSGDPDWKFYTWFSSDILPPDVIAAARRSMPPKLFKQEYEASFETSNGRIYEDYGTQNLTNETIQPHEQLMWFHDFNFTPLSSGIGVRRGQSLYCLDEIILTSAIARQSAEEFVNKFKDHENKNVIIYGDPAGRAGEKHGHASDYTEIEAVLRRAGWKLERRVKNAAPAIRDRQNAVRTKILNAEGLITLFVNQHKCPYTHKGLSTVSVKQGSTFLEVEDDYQHITTAVGYCIDFEWQVRRENTPTFIQPLPSVNYYNNGGRTL